MNGRSNPPLPDVPGLRWRVQALLFAILWGVLIFGDAITAHAALPYEPLFKWTYTPNAGQSPVDDWRLQCNGATVATITDNNARSYQAARGELKAGSYSCSLVAIMADKSTQESNAVPFVVPPPAAASPVLTVE